MKIPLPVLLVLMAFSGICRAQESVPLEEAQVIARKLILLAPAPADGPFAVEADPEHPAALRGGEAGVLVLPDKRLTAAAVAGAEKAYVPAGQIWAHKVAMSIKGSGIASDKLRTLTVTQGDQSKDVQLFSLGIVKNSEGGLELAIFGKGSEPVGRVALRKAGSGIQELPIQVSGERTGDSSARLTLSLLGQYAADLDFIKVD